MHSIETTGGRLVLVRGDLTEQRVDAIVNAANGSLLGGGGVDGDIHRRGGSAILEACRAVRKGRYPDGVPTGGAVITTGGDLPAPHVIHAVGPVWRGGEEGEADHLADAYRNALRVAANAGLGTVAFPSIGTGAYGYPVREAAAVALSTVLEVLRDAPGVFDEVRFVLFSEEDLESYTDALDQQQD